MSLILNDSKANESDNGPYGSLNSQIITNVDQKMPHLLSLPALVVEKIINYLTYEELSHIRRTSKMIKNYSERSLNEGFARLGRQVSTSSAILKKQLPKKESKRRSHPFNRYSEVFSTLETRYTLLSMTYKKYIDIGCCCFIPGKVLDMAFDILRQINGYLAKNLTVNLDVIGILCDLRDYSSMAMEHFDENIAPKYQNKSSILSIPSSFLRPGSSGKFTLPTFLPKLCTNAQNCSQSQESDFTESFLDEEFEALKTEMRNRLDKQDRIIDEQREALEEQKETIQEQRKFISQIIGLLGQIGKEDFLSPMLVKKIGDLMANFSAPKPTVSAKTQRIPGFDSGDSDTDDTGPPKKRMRPSTITKIQKKVLKPDSSKEETFISKTDE